MTDKPTIQQMMESADKRAFMGHAEAEAETERRLRDYLDHIPTMVSAIQATRVSNQHILADIGDQLLAQTPTKEVPADEWRGLFKRDLATILAALRFWQRHEGTIARTGSYEEDIASDEGQFRPLSGDEIDSLCQELNKGV